MKKLLTLLLLLALSNFGHAQKIFQENGKFGLKDVEGNIVLQAEYEQIFELSGRHWLLCKFDPNYSGEDAAKKHDFEEVKKGITSLIEIGDIGNEWTDEWSNSSESWSFEDYKYPSKKKELFPYLPNMLYGLISKDMSVEIPAKFKKIWILPEAKAYFVQKKGNYYEYDLDKNKSDKKVRAQTIEVRDGSIFFEKNGKWGAWDFSLESIIEPKYDKIICDEVGIYRLFKGDKFRLWSWGVIYPTILLQDYRDIDQKNREDFIIVKTNDKWGILKLMPENNGGVREEWTIEPFYQEIIPFNSTNYFFAKNNQKWGVIDLENKTIIDFQYEEMGGISGNLLYIKENGECKLFILKRDVIHRENQYDFTFDSLKKVESGNSKFDGLYEIYNNGKAGLFNTNTNKLGVPIKYSRFEYAPAIPKPNEDYLYQEEDNLGGFETDLDELPEETWIKTFDGDKVGMYHVKFDKIEEATSELIELFPAQYNAFEDISESGYNTNLFTHFLLKKNNGWGVYNTKNNLAEVIHEYSDFREITASYRSTGRTDRYFALKKGDKWGIYHTNKDLKNMTYEYDEIRFLIEFVGIRTAKKEGKWGMISEEGQITYLGFEFEELNQEGSVNIFAFKKNGKWGRMIADLLTEDGRYSISYRDPLELTFFQTILAAPEYDSVKGLPNMNRFTVVEKEGKFGLLDNEGKVILNTEFDKIEYKDKSTVTVEKGAKTGFANLKTGEVTYSSTD